MRFFVYAMRKDRLKAFYTTVQGELAGQVKFLRGRGWKVFWRKAA